MPNFTQDGLSRINDAFDGAKTLKELRTIIRKTGGEKVKHAQDNNFAELEADDWVLLNDYDGNLGRSG